MWKCPQCGNEYPPFIKECIVCKGNPEAQKIVPRPQSQDVSNQGAPSSLVAPPEADSIEKFATVMKAFAAITAVIWAVAALFTLSEGQTVTAILLAAAAAIDFLVLWFMATLLSCASIVTRAAQKYLDQK